MFEINSENIKQALRWLFYNKLLIVLFTGVGLFAGLLYWVNQSTEIEYDATATLSVAYGQNIGAIAGTTVLMNYADIVTSYRVTEPAANMLEGEELTGEQISDMVSVTETGTSFILRINARSDSPRTAIVVANAVADSFVTQITQITGTAAISVLDYSRTAEAIRADRSYIVILLAPAAAFFVICAVLVFIKLKSGKIWSLKQCVTDERELLTVIPKVSTVKSEESTAQ